MCIRASAFQLCSCAIRHTTCKHLSCRVSAGASSPKPCMMLAGPKGARLRHAIRLQARDVNAAGLMCNRLLEVVHGTSPNESLHSRFFRLLKHCGGGRTLGLLCLCLATATWLANSALAARSLQ
jgi:hypothetical protein